MNEHQQLEGFSPLTLFCSYSDEDGDLSIELEKHLSLLHRQGFIAIWHHRKIPAGSQRSLNIDEHLSTANIILLFISPAFLASDSSHDEMQRALQRHRDGTAQVIPLLLRPVDWESAPFAGLRYLPRNGKPVTMWRNRDLAFVEIVKGLRVVIGQEYHLDPAHPPVQSVPPTRSLFPFVFLASAHTDRPLADRLNKDLQTHHIMGWTNSQTRSASGSSEEELREAIRNSSAVVLIITPRTRRSRLCKEALRIAAMYQCPVAVFWMQGNQQVDIPVGDWIIPPIDARDARYSQAFQELLAILEQHPVSPTSQAVQAVHPLLKDPRNPYKGLRAFRSEDAQDFFGRDRLIREFIQALEQRLTSQQEDGLASRLLTLLGPSGSGKSSVVMAGVLPQLKQGGVAGSQRWIYLETMVPGAHPLEALVRALTPLFPERSLRSLREDLEEEAARGLYLLVAARATSTERKVVLVIDQFEELFTQTVAEYERQHFLDLLLTAISEPQGPLLAIITLRAGFYDRPLRYPELGRLIRANHVAILPMEIDDYRAIIERPAALPDVQITFEEDLIGDLLFEVQGQLGALPLLQFTLDQLFQKQKNRMLTRDAYREIGGIAGALVRHAEATYYTLSAEAQPLARELLLRLINPGTLEQEATKRRIPLTELRFAPPGKAASLSQVITTFTNARLLITTQVAQMPVLEIGHEALIQQWTRLANWLHAAREDVLLQKAISEDTSIWQQHGRSDDRLYQGSQLAEAQSWSKRCFPNAAEEEFLQASERYRRRRITRRTLLISLVSGGALAGMGGTGLLVYNLTQPLPTRHTDIVYSVTWSPDDIYIASASADKTVLIQEASSGRTVLNYTGHADSVYGAVWSPDGKRIASASADKTVQIWEAGTGKSLFTYTKHSNAVTSISWSHHGSFIASASANLISQKQWKGELHVWEADSGNVHFTDTSSPELSAAFWIPTEHQNSSTLAWSPDDALLAAASDDLKIHILEASTGHKLETLPFPLSLPLDDIASIFYLVGSVAWSHNGKLLASASGITVQIWRADTTQHVAHYVGQTNTVTALAWSPDDKLLAAASSDTTVVIWEISTGKRLVTNTGHTGVVWGVAWSHDGNAIASASADKTVLVWNPYTILSYMRHENDVLNAQDPFQAVRSVSWSPDQTRIASVGDDKTLQVWDALRGDFLFSAPLGYAANCVT